MATANTPDITKLSYFELKKLLDATQAALDSKRTEELKVLADGYAKKLQASGFGIDEGMEALRPYLPTKGGRKRSAPATGDKPYTAGVVYKNPNGSETWTGGTKGQMPAWLKAHIGDGSTASKAAKFAAIAQK